MWPFRRNEMNRDAQTEPEAQTPDATAQPPGDVTPSSDQTAQESGGDAVQASSNGPPSLEDRVVEALCRVYDPEIPVNIYELGLIYDVQLEGSDAQIKMTLTSPHCPVAESLPIQVEQTVESVDGVEKATVEIVWDPAWSPEMMSEAAKLELGMF